MTEGSPRRDPVVAFTATLGIMGIGTAIATNQVWPHRAAPWIMLPVLAALLAASAHLLIRFQYREQVMALDLFEAVLAGCILLFPSPVVLALTAFSLLFVELLHHRDEPRKIAFNIAQWVAAASAGSAAFHALGGGAPESPRTALALVGAMVVVAAVNLFAFAGVIRLAQGEPFRAVLRRLAPSIVLGWGVNTLFGLVFVATYAWTPVATGLFFVLLLVLHGGYRGYAAATADKARVEALHKATQTLSTEIDPHDALPAFVEVVRSCFGSEAAELVLFAENQRITYRRTATGGSAIEPTPRQDGLAEAIAHLGKPVRIGGQTDDITLASAMRKEGWRDCIAAPLVSDGEAIGVLCTFNRSGAEGFEHGEVAVLEALAREATNAIVKGKLLGEIMAERRRFSDIVNSTSDGIFTIAADGTILTWNPGLEAITGYLGTELIGTHLLDGLQPRDEEGRPVHVHTSIGTGKGPPPAIQITTRTGEVKWLSCSYTKLPPTDDTYTQEALIVVARDFTKAHELDRLKDDFVATVSHELRTPLTPIKGWAATLMDAGDRLDSGQRAAAAKSILRQAEGLEKLIVNLLDVAKIQRGLVDLHDNAMDVRAVVEKVAREARLSHPEREIRLETSGGLCRASGDELWLERIMSNLVSNALKYAPEHEPIDVSIAEGPGIVSINVKDRGPGIPTQDVERIFDRFQRLGDHMTRETGGAGLGLYISRQLAQAIGATLNVESTPGVGSEFILRLRAATGLVAVG